MGLQEGFMKVSKTPEIPVVLDPIVIPDSEAGQEIQKDGKGSKEEERELDKEFVKIFNGNGSEDSKRKAFEEIVSRYRERIFNYILTFVADRRDAEEVMWRTFFNAQRGLKDFRGESSFATWLYHIARNLAKNRFRREKVHKIDQHISFNTPISNDAENPLTLAELIPSEIISPGDDADAKDLSDRIQDKLTSVPLVFRTPLALFFIQKKTYREIADILNIGIGTVKSRIKRGRDYLRALLGMKMKENFKKNKSEIEQPKKDQD